MGRATFMTQAEMSGEEHPQNGANNPMPDQSQDLSAEDFDSAHYKEIDEIIAQIEMREMAMNIIIMMLILVLSLVSIFFFSERTSYDGRLPKKMVPSGFVMGP